MVSKKITVLVLMASVYIATVLVIVKLNIIPISKDSWLNYPLAFIFFLMISEPIAGYLTNSTMGAWHAKTEQYLPGDQENKASRMASFIVCLYSYLIFFGVIAYFTGMFKGIFTPH